MIHNADEGLVSPSDIADMAGVSRGAVSNWRKRADDFPAPIAGTETKPLFSRKAVTTWLESRGHKPRQDAGETDVWAALNLLRERLTAEDAADLVLSLAVARKRGEESAVQKIPNVASDTVRLVKDAVDRVDPEELGAAVDYTLERLSRSQGKGGADLGFVGSRTATLLANLAAARPGGALYDPACGIAAALVEAFRLGARATRTVGHDINPRALRIASRRAELHGVELELIETNVLAEDVDPNLRADTVILEPPFGVGLDTSARLTDPRFEFGPPPRMSADTAWLQHAIAHLSENGRAYVLSPSGTLFRGGEEGKVRTELVRRGCVEAVVGLPGKMLPHTSIPLALWVLRRPVASAATEHVLFIDASETVGPEHQVAGWLTNATSREVVPHAEITVADVLAGGSVLTTQRWVDRNEPAPEAVTSAYVDGWTAIQESVQRLTNILDLFEHFGAFSRSRVITVGDLIDQEVLDLRQGRPKDRYADAPKALRSRMVEARDVRDRSLREERLGRAFPEYPELTAEGDVLVTSMNEIRAVVDNVGGHVPCTGVYRLRVLDEDVLEPNYLALALTGSWNQRFQGGSYIKRAPIRELEVPLLPIHEQTSLRGAALQVDWLRLEAKELVTAATEVATALMDAVRYNAPLAKPVNSVGPSSQNGPEASEGAK